MKTLSSARGGAFLISLLTSILVSLIVSVFFHVYGPGIIDKVFSQTAEVPNVVGMSTAEASNALTLRKLNIALQGEANDPKAPKGRVLSQNPSSGLQVKKASSVALTISSGKTAVPKLALLPLEEAKARLSEAGLAAGEILDTENPQVPAGSVASSDPGEGREVPQGMPVVLTVSRGAGTARVPNVIGKQLPAAKRALAAAGLSVGNIRETTSEFYQFNVILDQNPKAGARAAKGSGVNITLNVEAAEE